MNNKNWGDKADKDLFFTILSVKNIGVISGSEWTTIGNHMRLMGYGFTNEGCRQHFQGLRRAQQKAEANGATGDNLRKIDPTQNPITRRPGPGRGRPRKSAASAAGDASPEGTAGVDPAHAHAHAHAQHQHQQQSPPPPPTQPHPQQQQIPQQALPPQPNMDSDVGPAPTPMMESAPQQQHVVMQPDEVSFDDADEEPDERAAKRAKLEENHDPALNDEAILSALAAHNNPGSVEHYNTDFYGEA